MIYNEETNVPRLTTSSPHGEIKEERDLNNNIPQIKSHDASTPVCNSSRPRIWRHRPDGESPERPLEDVETQAGDALPEAIATDEVERTPEEASASSKPVEGNVGAWQGISAAAQQQQLMNAYYADLMMWQYYASLASMMTPNQGAGLPWGVAGGNPQLQTLLVQQQQQQQQQQLSILKWYNHLASTMWTQSQAKIDQNYKAAPDKTNEKVNARGERVELNFSQAHDFQRTRIDMEEFRKELSVMTQVYRSCMTAGDSNIERAASSYRSAATSERHKTISRWEGCLHIGHPLSVTYSRKVFVGGVPWDMTDMEIRHGLKELGSFEIVWPQGRERKSQRQYYRAGNAGNPVQMPRGYCYLVFDEERQVKSLLQRCVVRDGATYVRLSNSRNPMEKEAQVIPWCIADATYSTKGLHSTNAKTTVFVGALHGMITAANLATIMSDTFGDVICAALDTDRFKYPIGSGRVVFSNSESYREAVEANFLEVKTPKFSKTIQIDPYLEDSMCSVCYYAPGVYFCRSTICFQYYCPPCWQSVHRSGDEERGTHKPLRRTFRNPIDRKFM